MKKIITICVILLFGIGGFFILNKNNTQNSISKTAQTIPQNEVPTLSIAATQNQNSKISVISNQQKILKDDVSTTSSTASNSETYTSHKLGVQFTYLKNGGKNWKTGIVTPREYENSIYLDYITNGKMLPKNQNFIKIFEKLPNESIDQALRRLVPHEFKDANCVVLLGKSKNQYFIWDKREQISQRASDDVDFILPNGDVATNTCGVEFPLYFITDPNFPNKLYYISYDTQAPTYSGNLSETINWTQTVHLIQ